MSISQLIATQAQRNQGPSPMQQLAALESMKGQKIRNEAGQTSLMQNKRIEGLKFAANVKDQLDSIEDPVKKNEIYQTALQFGRMNGHDVSPYPEQYDEEADRLLSVMHMQARNPAELQRRMKAANYQFGNQTEMKDAAGNVFLVSARRNPNDGMIESVITSVDGANIKPTGRLMPMSSSGLTSGEKVEQDKTIFQNRQDVRSKTEPEIQANITQAKEEVKARIKKSMEQAGNLNKVQDADRIYQSLSTKDLDKIYGKGERYYPELLRSQEGIDMMAERDQLIGMLKIGARGELKGQGPITDSEQKILSDAATTLGNMSISPEKAKAALNEAMNVIYRNAGKTFTAPEPQKSEVDLQSLSDDELLNF